MYTHTIYRPSKVFDVEGKRTKSACGSGGKGRDFGITKILPLTSCVKLAFSFVKRGHTDLLQSGLEC